MTTKKKTTRKPKPVADYVLPPGRALVLRTCKADMSSNSEYADGFKWPKSGPVKCDDWLVWLRAYQADNADCRAAIAKRCEEEQR